MAKKSSYYDYDVAVLKKYGDDYKLVRLRAVRKKGYEIKRNYKNRCQVNDKKLENNISRAKQKIFEYAKCNDWDYFCTFTLDKDKYNRYDLKQYIKDLGKFINNQNSNRDENIKYLLIPEQHKDGAWHMHGLFVGLLEEELTRYQYSDFENGRIPNYIRDKLDNDEPIYRWQKYQDRFGYCVFDEIRIKDAVSKYIVKYVNKDMASSVTELNSKMYYCSQGLNTADEIKRGRLLVELEPDYKNDFVKVNWLDWLDEPKMAETLIQDDRELIRNCKAFNLSLLKVQRKKIKETGWIPVSPSLEKQIKKIFSLV